MKKFLSKFSVALAIFVLPYYLGSIVNAEDPAPLAEDVSASDTAPESNEAIPVNSSDNNNAADKAKDEVVAEDTAPLPTVKKIPVVKNHERADAFVAGADWEFDGFVAGGQDSGVRSMFYLNDLIYINIGSQQGLSTGDKIGVYKRGDRVRDPQSGKFIGYEVRRAAIAKVSDRVEDEVAAVRILSTYEPVEVGDLVRKEQ